MTFDKLMTRSFGTGSSFFWRFFADGLTIQDVRRFLDEGGNVNQRAESGQTLLHIAADSCELEIVQLLVDRGADINAKGLQGHRPLHLAVDADCDSSSRNGRRAAELPVTTLLIRSGADESMRNDNGETARDFAVAYGSAETALYDAIPRQQR